MTKTKKYIKMKKSGSPDMDIWKENIRKLQQKELLSLEEENIILDITKRLP